MTAIQRACESEDNVQGGPGDGLARTQHILNKTKLKITTER